MKLEDLGTSYKKLPTFSPVALKMLKMIKRDTFTVEEISDIISSDVALTAKVLRVANSPFFRRVMPVKTVYDAFMVIGQETAKYLALSFSIMEMLTIKSRGFDSMYFWKNSLTTGVAAEILATMLNHFRAHEFFFIGFLQDLGVLTLYNHAPDTYKKILEEKARTGDKIHLVEQRMLGLDHQDAGNYICRIWDFPESIYLPISAHHNPQSLSNVNGDILKAAKILNVADLMSDIYYGREKSGKIAELYNICTHRFSLKAEDIDRFGDIVGKDMKKVLEFFDIKSSGAKSYAEIIREANKELTQVNGSCAANEGIADKEDTGEDIRQLIITNERLREEGASGHERKESANI